MAYTTIDDPSAHFQTVLYTGNGGSNAITNDGNSDLQPDLTWLKERSSTSSHQIIDSSRGDEVLYPDTTDAEGDVNYFTENSDGFTLGTNNGINENTETYVAWQWKANGGTTTSGAGNDTIAVSTHQANTTAGFSIVTYTGEDADKTIKHGLSSAPEWIITKDRGATLNWNTYHIGVGNDKTCQLNLTNAESATDSWQDTNPGSSVYSIGDVAAVNTDGNTLVAYCFHSVQGYSKFGSFTGNGNDDGPFIYTGFKPALVIVKRVNNSGAWHMYSSSANGIHRNNEITTRLEADTSDAAKTHVYYQMDFISNGFKFWEEGDNINGDGDTMIYCAWAEHPFVSSEGVPATAV